MHWDGAVVAPDRCPSGLESVGDWAAMHGVVLGFSVPVGQRREVGIGFACSVEG